MKPPGWKEACGPRRSAAYTCRLRFFPLASVNVTPPPKLGRISAPVCQSTPRFRNIICNQRFAMISGSPLIRQFGDSMGPVTSTWWQEGQVVLGLEQEGFLVAMHFGLRNQQYPIPVLALNAWTEGLSRL
jgi:hypothetical protein